MIIASSHRVRRGVVKSRLFAILSRDIRHIGSAHIIDRVRTPPIVDSLRRSADRSAGRPAHDHLAAASGNN